MAGKCPFKVVLLSCIAKILFGTAIGIAQGKASDASTPQLRTDVRLVVLDVMVTDSHGKAISKLSLEDFNLTENGVVQNIKNLQDHTTTPVGKSAAIVETPLPAGTYSNRPKLQSNMWNVIVVDMLNTPAQGQVLARQALRIFARQLPSGAPIALGVMTSASVKLLVPFTPNGAEISKLLDGDALFSTHSPLLDTYNADDEAQLEGFIGLMKRSGNIKEAYRETEMDRLGMRVEQTLRSLDGLAAWLAHLPGKKNLYWLSAGFPLSAEPQTMRDGLANQMTARWRENYASA